LASLAVKRGFFGVKNVIQRVAAVHDLSGFGGGSLAAVIPILSAMGIQVCSLPTAILSTHTGGFTDFHFRDLTEDMSLIVDHWRRLGLSFAGNLSGFLDLATDCTYQVDSPFFHE
jgi:pyridoxine kinase